MNHEIRIVQGYSDLLRINLARLCTYNLSVPVTFVCLDLSIVTTLTPKDIEYVLDTLMPSLNPC
jgi:hypothetical protein